MHFEQTFNLPA